MYVEEIFELQGKNFKVEALVTSANEIKPKWVKRRKKEANDRGNFWAGKKKETANNAKEGHCIEC